MSQVVIHRRAAKYLKSLPQPLRERIKVVLTQLSEDILNYPGIIRMAGDWAGYHRIRVGHDGFLPIFPSQIRLNPVNPCPIPLIPFGFLPIFPLKSVLIL